ncbi:MAG TPA: hypothetical protein VGC46_12365 [Allosphingosinicella sp.]
MLLTQLARRHAAVVAAGEARGTAVDQAEAAIEAQALDLARIAEHHCAALGTALRALHVTLDAILAPLGTPLAAIVAALDAVVAPVGPELMAVVTPLGAPLAPVLAMVDALLTPILATVRPVFATIFALGDSHFPVAAAALGAIVAAAAILSSAALTTMAAALRLLGAMAAAAVFSRFCDTGGRHRHGEHARRKKQFTHVTPPTYWIKRRAAVAVP